MDEVARVSCAEHWWRGHGDLPLQSSGHNVEICSLLEGNVGKKYFVTVLGLEQGRDRSNIPAIR